MQQYLLKGEEEKTNVVSKPVEVKEDEKPATVVSEEIVEKAEEPPAPAAEEKTEETPAAVEESTETPATAESNSEDTPAAAEETNEATEENSGKEAAEEKREIKVTIYQDILRGGGIIVSYSFYFHLHVSHIFIL
jgi:cytochrome c oxidase subunit 6b